MKIIAETSGGYLLEATRDEVHALSEGKAVTHDQYGNRLHAIGRTFEVGPVWRHMQSLKGAAENARHGAAFLRGLAEILDKGIPDWIAEPAPPAEPKAEAANG